MHKWRNGGKYMMKIILIGVIYLFLIGLCFTSTLLVRVCIFVVNCILPDPIPYADEFLMGMGILVKAVNFWKNPVLFVLKYLAIIGGIILAIYFL